MKKDLKTYIFWLEQAAKRKDPKALEALATAYEQGIGVKKNPKKARKLRERLK